MELRIREVDNCGVEGIKGIFTAKTLSSQRKNKIKTSYGLTRKEKQGWNSAFARVTIAEGAPSVIPAKAWNPERQFSQDSFLALFHFCSNPSQSMLPKRIRVAPSSIAISKSLLIPIESSGSFLPKRSESSSRVFLNN